LQQLDCVVYVHCVVHISIFRTDSANALPYVALPHLPHLRPLRLSLPFPVPMPLNQSPVPY
jgi:hypothetical protein